MENLPISIWKASKFRLCSAFCNFDLAAARAASGDYRGAIARSVVVVDNLGAVGEGHGFEPTQVVVCVSGGVHFCISSVSRRATFGSFISEQRAVSTARGLPDRVETSRARTDYWRVRLRPS